MTTPAAPTADPATRTGRCLAKPACRRQCARYERAPDVGGWRYCACGHTQGVHEPEETHA